MIRNIEAKTILQKVKFDNSKWFGIDYNMNLYKGCSHGCIYCDSRSDRYFIENFDVVRYKQNAVQILNNELYRKHNTGVIGIGAMSDTYNPVEKKIELTKKSLELIARNHYGVSIDTKSDLILRDIHILKEITKNNSAIVKITITTCNDELSKIIEPNVATSSKRFEVVKKLNDSGIFCGILLTPMLPYITDNPDDIRLFVKKAYLAKAKFIYCMYGMTMRDGQREYYYANLATHFSNLVRLYKRQFGNAYVCDSPNKEVCKEILIHECNKYGILTNMEDIIRAYKKVPYEQLSLF